MPLPASWTLVPVVGDYTFITGDQPAGAQVIFEAPQAVVIGGQVIVPQRIVVVLDADGKIPAGTTLPSTDDPDLNVTGWAYKVIERMRGGRPPYYIFVPHTEAQIDMATVAPVAPPADMVSALSAMVIAAAQGFADQAEASADAAEAAAIAAQDAVDSIGPSLPAGGAAGQSLRKVDATDGNAAWSSHWVVDPTTGALTESRSYTGGYEGDTPQQFLNVSYVASYTGPYADIYTMRLRLRYEEGFSFEVGRENGNGSSQVGFVNFQFGQDVSQDGSYQFQAAARSTQNYGFSSAQFGDANSQRGGSNAQFGTYNTQSGGYGHFQAGANNTQSSYYNFQAGKSNTQSGDYGAQLGRALNDGGFDYTFMAGHTKTATVTRRAYFAMDNGVWLKPFAGDPATPENGVMGYNSTLGKFRFYQGGAWQNLLSDNEVWKIGADGKTQVLLTHAATLPSNTPLSSVKALTVQGSINRTHWSGTGTVNFTSQMEFTQGGSLRLSNFNTAYPSSNTTQNADSSLQFASNGSTQSGIYSFQMGNGTTQSNTYGCFQLGNSSTQSGSYNFQIGYNTQSGSYNFQTGYACTQSGQRGFQAGQSLNDGGFDYTFMAGHTKTATVARRAYFALDNGIWLKPFAGDAASPENGVIGYNSTLSKFRAYENGAWKDLVTDWRVVGYQTQVNMGTDPTVRNYSTASWPAAERRFISVNSTWKKRNFANTADLTYRTEMRMTKFGTFELLSMPDSITDPESLAFSSLRITSFGGTQAGLYNLQFGNTNYQSGNSNFQNGNNNTQSGYYGYQNGYNNTLSGYCGFQSGHTLNNGGFDYVTMFGDSKTATVAQRAYFALNNGIWLKPVATAPTSPENGVMYYDSTTNKFRGYANGAWVDLH